MRRNPARGHTSARTRPHRFKTLIVVLVLVMVAAGIGFVRQSLFWTRQWRTNFIFYTDPLLLVSVPQTDDEKILLVTLPTDMRVTVPHGYGSYRLAAVPRLAQLEKKPNLVAETVEDLLGLKITGWIGSTEQQMVPLTGGDKNAPMAIISPPSILLRHYQSSLNQASLFHLSFKLLFSRTEDMIKYDLQEVSGLLVTANLADGTTETQVDMAALDAFLETRFTDQTVRDEGLRIEVKNATGKSSVGQSFVRFLTNFGGQVISVGNEDATVDRCQVRVPLQNQSAAVVRFLRQEFGCDLSEQTATDKAEITVVVGNQFGQRWATRAGIR